MSAAGYDANGVLRELWDDVTRTVTYFDETGAESSSRSYTVAENIEADTRIDVAQREGNERTIRDRATTALTTNRAFLDLGTPTNAQVVAQVKALTRQNNGLIRLILEQFDAVE